ncbi:MAG: substrate-binding domain-containing protein [Xanthobacteraceae bacterium]|nr:substrate-binding domain-containing protein [Xanthobacteraceae bacterium]
MRVKVTGTAPDTTERQPFASTSQHALPASIAIDTLPLQRGSAIQGQDSGLAGEVKIAVTEGLGTFWIAPRLVEYQAALPNLFVDLNCSMKQPNFRQLSTGVGIQLVEPNDPSLEKVRIGTLHSYPFAASSYVQRFGVPKSLGEIRKHRLVLQLADQTATQELYERVLPDVPQSDLVAVRTNSSIVHFWTIASGTGIGCLPSYVVALASDVVPIDIGLHFSFAIWLVCRPEVRRIPRVGRTIEWLVDSFDSRRYPWFAEQFIHPRELLDRYHGEPLPTLFDYFSDNTDRPTPIH